MKIEAMIALKSFYREKMLIFIAVRVRNKGYDYAVHAIFRTMPTWLQEKFSQVTVNFSTIIQFMWQDDMRAVAFFIKVYLDVYYDVVIRSWHQISPRWLGFCNCISLEISFTRHRHGQSVRGLLRPCTQRYLQCRSSMRSRLLARQVLSQRAR